ncbi:hypothetical protein KSX_56500 [Ktedonospora formicarum]|uniref:Uncharacterized protein n=1 Tax=Ktedonospora formicarum TaxID=2778364 RepID=A0A8J3MSV2_9CHLR|nr:hypothetical protein KSX_56500 [Ktedonospora formicarum]
MCFCDDKRFVIRLSSQTQRFVIPFDINIEYACSYTIYDKPYRSEGIKNELGKIERKSYAVDVKINIAFVAR